jgi:hypothetical protein
VPGGIPPEEDRSLGVNTLSSSYPAFMSLRRLERENSLDPVNASSSESALWKSERKLLFSAPARLK